MAIDPCNGSSFRYQVTSLGLGPRFGYAAAFSPFARWFKPRVRRAQFLLFIDYLRNCTCGFPACFLGRADRNRELSKSDFSRERLFATIFAVRRRGCAGNNLWHFKAAARHGPGPRSRCDAWLYRLYGRRNILGEQAVQLGVATFLVNSFAGRNIPRVCTGPHTISIASLLTDVYRARELLAAHPRVDPKQIALMGFSFGGRTALWASYLRFQGRYDPGPSRFAAYLAFYPTICHIKPVDEDRVDAVPIRLLRRRGR